MTFYSTRLCLNVTLPCLKMHGKWNMLIYGILHDGIWCLSMKRAVCDRTCTEEGSIRGGGGGYVNIPWVLAFYKIKAIDAEKQTLVSTLKHYLDWSTCRAVICKVPFSIRLMRSSLPRILWPSRSHWMLGRGLPITWHCNWAVVPGASVWLAGPWRMMGGIRSDGAKGEENERGVGHKNQICM